MLYNTAATWALCSGILLDALHIAFETCARQYVRQKTAVTPLLYQMCVTVESFTAGFVQRDVLQCPDFPQKLRWGRAAVADRLQGDEVLLYPVLSIRMMVFKRDRVSLFDT